ncbi:MAG TPA: prolipoprotein diacylglyceryl transferase [Bacteroidales bacterium]|nr:prolipoprotein diacylglyceryl transferase [Bacteroidales bacterium]
MLQYIVWDVSPKIFTIGSFEVRWYGMFFALSFFLGFYFVSKFFKKEGVPAGLLDKLTIYMFIGTLIGARLGHCLFYQPDIYLADPIKILYVWEGGLASHGAFIGIVLSLYIFHRIDKISLWWVLDRIVIVTALAAFFIRTGNLMNSEIIGTESTVPWAFKFVRNPDYANGYHHPSQLYEAIFYLGVFIFLFWSYYRKDAQIKGGLFFGYFLILVFGFRFFIEFLKESQVEFENSMTLNMGQWLSIPVVLLGIFMIFFSAKRGVEIALKDEPAANEPEPGTGEITQL